MSEFFVTCPHCKGDVGVLYKQVNCKIFRHGIFRENGRQIDPHLSKEKCDDLHIKNKIWGCGKPFRITQDASNCYYAVICDYI